MKKHILALIFIVTAIHGFADGFDDMAYSNPDFMTYFQQEMSSLMKFQFENDINIPFFLSASTRNATLTYKSAYLNSLYPDGVPNAEANSVSGDFDMDGIIGFQIRLNRALYLTFLGGASRARFDSYIDGEWTYQSGVINGEIKSMKAPVAMSGERVAFFAGGGLSLNTGILKGGMYLGWGLNAEGGGDNNDPNNNIDNQSHGLRIAVVPLVDTSGMKYIGMALNYLLGFLDMGDALMMATEDKGDAKIDAFVNTFNAGLDFAFNRIHFDAITLQPRAIYARSSFDTAARANTYGLNVQGRLARFPLGFTLEGGYKQFYALPQYYERLYGNGTGYFNGSVYFPFKKITLGVVYGYDKIYHSKITFALSTNFLSGFFTSNPISPEDKDTYFSGDGFEVGARYRHGGWNVKEREEEFLPRTNTNLHEHREISE
jgi:hypothetical protein